ncbi:helix-turn-helix domain-containing protein [Paenibacillus sacheonensis]|uniref:Helix-turn-helix domain-containing protein n=1 Tax=Paenibacillus sacheonensis TaxID=742054 RepID=A0A7X4YV16_9BACL|nr:helix-turn-helix transcriptional regulator [Paenibacillus sacheonensis]MBM7567727.1 DNA-binding Xre family transcriptional regulator [Paenibacillus sacheonensis]NBC71999.1 helix-turn-helix domain-containing protein [Paenibacillus sacheonensis]
MMLDLLSHSPNPIMVVRIHQNRRHVYACNAAFYSLTGCAGEELIGLPIASLPLLGSKPLWSIVDLLCDSITSHNLEAYAESYFSLSDSASSFGEFHVKQTMDAGDTYLIVTVHDRSEDKWIEDTAHERQALVSMRLTPAGTALSLRGYRGPIAYDHLELSRTEPEQFIADQDRERVLNQLRELQFSRQTGEFHFTLRLFHEQFRIHSLVKPFFNGDGTFRCYAALVLTMEPAIEAEVIEGAPVNEHEVPAAGSDASYKLRLLMLEKRVSVTQLAENTQISLTTISNIRNGKIKRPQRLTAQLIADELGVSPTDIWEPYK